MPDETEVDGALVPHESHAPAPQRRPVAVDPTELILRHRIEAAETPEDARGWIEALKQFQDGQIEIRGKGRQPGKIAALFILMFGFGMCLTYWPVAGAGWLNWIFIGAALYLVAPDFVRLVVDKIPSLRRGP